MTSESKYKSVCERFLKAILERPSMHIRSFEDLETVMYGHFCGFVDRGDGLGSSGEITMDESFNRCFSDWLRSNYRVSTSGGWAVAFKVLEPEADSGKLERSKRLQTFENFFEKFVIDWNAK